MHKKELSKTKNGGKEEEKKEENCDGSETLSCSSDDESIDSVIGRIGHNIIANKHDIH